MPNRFRLFRFASTGIAVLLLTATLARAATPTFQYQALPGATSNGSTSIGIYLTETSYSGTNLLQSELGLSDSGVQITRTSGDAAITAATPNSAFNDSSSTGTFSASSASFSLAIADNNSDTTGVLTNPNQTLLGVVQISAGTTASIFTVANTSRIYQSVTFKDLYDLDKANNGTPSGPPIYSAAISSQFTLPAPEPGVSSLSFVLITLLFRRRMRSVR